MTSNLIMIRFKQRSYFKCCIITEIDINIIDQSNKVQSILTVLILLF